MSKRQAVAEFAQMLDAVRIPDAKARITMYPHEFSGGMRQRIMIAMALLADIRKEFGTAMILITHDLGIVAGACERTLVIYGGQIIEQGETVPLFETPSHPYTKGLLRAVPRIDRDDDKLLTIAGEPADMSNLPAGCPFSPRCDLVKDICVGTKPPLEAHGERKRACRASVEEVARDV